MAIEEGDILFLHGLEGSPQGNKAVWLRAQYGAEAVPLDTSVAREGAARVRIGDPGWHWRQEDVAEALRLPVAQARAALSARPRRLLVGSSFGGAVLMELVQSGHWRGPCIFLAPAAAKMGRRRPLPTGVRAHIIHGNNDDVVPLADSRRLVADCAAGVTLQVVEDDHRLQSILLDGTLAKAVEQLL